MREKIFGFHPLLGYVDHGTDGAGEPVAELLRPGRAGSNTAADHVTVLERRWPRSRPRCGSATHRGADPLAQNLIWLAISALAQDLLAWCARLALPATAPRYERKRLRLRILAVAGRLVRTARQRVLHIDPAWPWADTITTAHTRLIALAGP